MVVAVLILLVALVALAYVTAPLRGRQRPILYVDDDRLRRAEERKEAALTGILDIEHERELGKLSLSEFEALRAEYEGEALEALKELDSVVPVERDPVEAEIAEARRRLACPSCGSPRRPGESCSRCTG